MECRTNIKTIISNQDAKTNIQCCNTTTPWQNSYTQHNCNPATVHFVHLLEEIEMWIKQKFTQVNCSKTQIIPAESAKLFLAKMYLPRYNLPICVKMENGIHSLLLDGHKSPLLDILPPPQEHCQTPIQQHSSGRTKVHTRNDD